MKDVKKGITYDERNLKDLMWYETVQRPESTEETDVRRRVRVRTDDRKFRFYSDSTEE